MIVFTEWWARARPTERRWNRYLVVSLRIVALMQYWTMVAIVGWTGTYLGYTLVWFAKDFDRYNQWLSWDCTLESRKS